jgi:hypothetical protein
MQTVSLAVPSRSSCSVLRRRVLETQHARRALRLFNVATLNNLDCRIEAGTRRRFRVECWCTRAQWRGVQVLAKRDFKSGAQL